MATNPKMAPCANGHPADYLSVYKYESGWQRVECDHIGCWYIGPSAGSTRQAIKLHNRWSEHEHTLAESARRAPV